MKGLAERIAERKAQMEKDLRYYTNAETKLTQFVSGWLEQFRINAYVGKDSISIEIYPQLSAEELETSNFLANLQALSDERIEWKREALEDNVTRRYGAELVYRGTAYFGKHKPSWITADGAYLSDFPIYLTIYPQIKGTCRVIRLATGKKRTVSKTIEIEEPEIELLVDCSE